MTNPDLGLCGRRFFILLKTTLSDGTIGSPAAGRASESPRRRSYPDSHTRKTIRLIRADRRSGSLATWGRRVMLEIMMKTLNTPHVSFRELPLEDRWLFYIFALGAYAFYRSNPPSMADISIAPELIWNRNQLSPSDLNPPRKIVDLLLQEFKPLGKDFGRRAV